MSRSSKKLRRTLAIVLAFVMVASIAVPSTPAQAAAKKYVKSLKVSPKKVTLTSGGKKTVKATVKVSGKAKKNVTVKSSNKKVVTVKTKKANRKGISTITLTAKNVTSRKSAKITVTTSAKNKKGKKVKKTINVTVNPKAGTPTGGKNTPRPTAAARTYTVSKVSAINTETGEVVLTFTSPVTASVLAGTTLTIKGDNNTTVSAAFSKISGDGYSATYVISKTDLGKVTTGDYTIVANNASVVLSSTVGGTTAKVQITGSSVKGFVYNKTDEEIMIPQAQITIDGSTVSADKFGFYQKPVSAGKYNISVKAKGYFDETKKDIKVVDNNASAYNFAMEKYDISKVYICGTVIDSEDSQKPVKDATVALFEDDEVKAILKTDASGRYVFRNSNAKVENFEVDSASNRRFPYYNNIRIDKKYRIIISKDLAKNNLDSVYEQIDTGVIDLGSARNINIDTKMRKVANVGEIAMNLSWAKDTVLKSADSTKVKVSFVDVDGETELVAPKEIDLAASLNDEYNSMGDKVYKLADTDYFGTGKRTPPTLPSGTYYLIVSDVNAKGAQVNAITVVPVKITEGGSAETKATIAPAVSRTVNYALSETDTYGETAKKNQGAILKNVVDEKGTLGTANIEVTAKVYQEVNGKNVLVYTNPDITLGKNSNAYTYNESVENLAADQSYSVETVKSHLTASPVAIAANNADPVTVTLRTAANVVKVKMKDAERFADSETKSGVADSTQRVMVNSVTVTGKAARDGKTVTATAVIDKEYALSALANGIPVDDVEFMGLEPGKYTVSFDIDGYKASSEELKQDEERDVIDLQDATIECEAVYNRVYPTTITGTIIPKVVAGNTELGAKGVAVLYTSDLKKVVAANALYTAGNGNPAYKLEDGINGNFGAGKYKLIIRAKGMDILQKDITIDAENKIYKSQDFENVEVGGNSAFRIPITTSNGMPLEATADVFARDTFYRDPFDLSEVDILAADYLIDNYAYVGMYALALAENKTETWQVENIPAGDYIISVDSSITKFTEEERTLKGTNTEALKVPLLVYDDLVRVQLSITNMNASFSAGQIDFITVESKDGSVFNYGNTERTKQKEEIVYFYVPKNQGYTVSVFSTGACVGITERATQSSEDMKVYVTCPEIE